MKKIFIPLIKENLNSFDYPKEQLELIVVDDGDENLMSEDDDKMKNLSPFIKRGKENS